jgi:dihydropteroate synthase
MVNDVSAGRDPAMFPLVAERRAAMVLMHMRGEPRTMQSEIRYGDLLTEIFSYLDDRSRAALEAGVPRERILVDPGFGFGKLVEHNLVLLRRLREFRCLGFSVVAGTSRKTFIGKVLGDVPVHEREAGTAATVALAVWNGAAIVRVHDVRTARHVVQVTEAIIRGRETVD